ncbi:MULTISPECIES: DUF6895 family protein [unclassified Streptomyces]|uniref:DUF6895 family protein n=1 Tax=unclassified Streptomyces TaxID=2593676 RepID=UPI00381BD5BC
MAMSLTQNAHRITSQALAWLHTNREYGMLPPDSTAELSDPDNAYKPLGETALAASLVLREGVAGATELRLARELLDFCWKQLRGGDLLHERLLRYPLMSDPLETYVHFARCGIRHEALDRLLAHTTSLRSARSSEAMPNRRLAVANAIRVGGFEHDSYPVDWTGLTRATWLGAVPEPWLIDWMGGYNMTHTVFHLTDWGRLPSGLPEDIAGYLDHWLPVWLDVWTEIGEWDLMGELLIVGDCLPVPPAAPSAWEQLDRIQHKDGLVPRSSDPVEGDAAHRFHTHHHPTVVAAVAGTLAVSRALGARAA